EMFHDNRYSFVDIQSPDFVAIAKGYQVPGETVAEREGLVPAVQRFLDSEGSYLLEVMVGRENNVFPFVPPGAGVAEIRLQ
ncbi:MAG: thiamine pyrophosphate-dependent enzyme, partial [Bacteroidota bacterium]